MLFVGFNCWLCCWMVGNFSGERVGSDWKNVFFWVENEYGVNCV